MSNNNNNKSVPSSGTRPHNHHLSSTKAARARWLSIASPESPSVVAGRLSWKRMNDITWLLSSSLSRGRLHNTNWAPPPDRPEAGRFLAPAAEHKPGSHRWVCCCCWCSRGFGAGLERSCLLHNNGNNNNNNRTKVSSSVMGNVSSFTSRVTFS